MPVNIVVPQLGESILEATVAEWLKREGDSVAAGDALVRLETEKVDLEVGAESAGTLARIAHGSGDEVRVGDVLGVIEAEGAGQGAVPGGVAPGATLAPGATPPAAAGGAEAPSGTGRAAPDRPEAAPGARTRRIEAAPEHEITPVARRVAGAMGIDVGRVPGSGPKGRVTKEDVQSFAGSAASAGAMEAPPAPPSRPEAAAPRPESVSAATAGPGERPAATAAPWLPPAPAPARAPGPQRVPAQAPGGVAPPVPPAQTEPPGQAAEGRKEIRQRMSRRRQTIARRLLEAQQTAAILTTFNEVDMTAVMDVRKRRREAFAERHGVGLGFTSFFVKASIGALKAFPRLNAEIQGADMILKGYYDIGIAVGAEEGLVVPVLRDADRMSFAEIERQVKAFADKARKGELTLEDLRGGTFTVTNGGVFGSLLSTPILNPPQVGILGLHKIEERPVAAAGQVVIRPMMYVALSYDHRIVDGREAVQFLVRVKELIEEPESLLLEG